MSRRSRGRNRWQKIRKFINDIHLWLGLTSGLIVIAICFSGTVYVFNTELTERAAPHLYKVKPLAGQQRLASEALLKNIQSVADGKIINISIPADRKRTYQFTVKKEGDSLNRGGVTFFVNPYTGEITGTSKDKNGTKELMATIFSLHRWLLLDRVKKPIIQGLTNRELGSIITGTATIIFTLGCLTGLIIWLPQRVKAWNQGLRIKWNAGWKRLNHDLHNTLAFYALLFLLTMGLTGPQWSFEWYRTALQQTLGTYKPKAPPKAKVPKSKGQADSITLNNLPVSDYIKKADEKLTYQGNYSITVQDGPTATIVITKTKLGFFAPAAGDRIMIDQQNGNVIKLDIFKNKPFNERIAGSIKAIHVGNVYGTFTKMLYFFACLIATTLPVTGTMIWLNKMKKKKRNLNMTTRIPMEDGKQVA